eukprot:351775-Chlamydomonas_euryale.AAC.5
MAERVRMLDLELGKHAGRSIQDGRQAAGLFRCAARECLPPARERMQSRMQYGGTSAGAR